METICNYLVLQRCKAIGGRAGYPFKNDCKGREEADATKGSGIGDAEALTATQQLMESDATARIDEEQFRKEADKYVLPTEQELIPEY
jgi:hypothetical protein